jgi:hypothetical protein
VYLLVMLRSAVPIVLFLLAGTPAPLGAQALRLDLTAANRHLWRGVNRTTGWVGQIDLSTATPLGPGALAVGVFESRELSRAGAGDLTEVGLGRKGLGERDWWLEYRTAVGSQEIFAGLTRYTFHGNRQLGGRSSGDNTTEISLGAQSKLTYLSPALALHWDVEKVGGMYLEASGALPLLGWPFPPPVNVYLDAALGLSFGQGPDAAHPDQLAYYAGDGFTHVATGLSVDLQQGEHFTTGIGARVQAGIDDEAHRGSNGRRRNLFVSCWVGTTLRLGRLPR